ncbi:MAG: hypothetical protein GY809_29395, partial [Planctomycetes bacterium]|nr:hypothetical protein [Planctomycetota bacterium]
MEDIAKLEQILKAECPCISIVTREEEYTLEVIHSAAMGSKTEPDTDLFLEVIHNAVPLSVT